MATLTPSKVGEKVQSPEDLLRRTIKVSEWNPSLTLLYFHTPHEELAKDKLVGAAGATFRQCATFGDRDVQRWLGLYHPVEVDMGPSDVKTAERLGMKDGAIMAVVDQDLNVLATMKPTDRPEGVAAFLKATLKSDACKTFWAPIEKTIAEQKVALDEARALARQDKWKEASEKYESIVMSGVKVADFYNDAVREAGKAARKAKDEK
jgi:hypothetical protein